MVRDRLPELLQILKENGSDYSTEVIVILDHNSRDVDNFLYEVQKVLTLLNKITDNISELKNLHDTILTQPTDSNKTNEEIKRKDDNIKKCIYEVHSNLKKMAIKIEKMTGEDSKPKPEILKKIEDVQYSALLKLLSKVNTNYNNALMHYKERCESILKQQLKIKNKIVSNEEVQELLDRGEVSLFVENILAETAEAKLQLDAIQARHQELLKIEHSLEEMRNQFMELAILIENQGEKVDCIEYLVLNAEDNTENAKKRIQKIKERKRKKRKCLYTVAFLIAIILLILFLIAASF